MRRLLGYLWWGTERTAVTSFYSIRRSVPDIWGRFHDGLPEIGNARALDAIYWASIVALILGVLALIWLALAPIAGRFRVRVERDMSLLPSLRIRMRDARAIDLGWLFLFVAVVLWVFYRLGAFDLWNSIPMPDGTTERFVRTFGAADHPFHATRAELLRRSLTNGDLLRWVSAHQGGYPVEFYPLGAAAFEVLVWALLLGVTANDGGAQDRSHRDLSPARGWLRPARA